MAGPPRLPGPVGRALAAVGSAVGGAMGAAFRPRRPLVRCSICGRKNRVDLGRIDAARCGACGAALNFDVRLSAQRAGLVLLGAVALGALFQCTADRAGRPAPPPAPPLASGPGALSAPDDLSPTAAAGP